MSITWFVPRSDLSPDQLRAVDLPIREHAIVLGAPGSGKTLVLLHRAKRLIEEEGVPPERLRIFVFTNTLKDYIRSTLALLDIPETCVTTFDYWCRDFFVTFISPCVPFTNHAPDFDAIRSAVLGKLQEGTLLPLNPQSTAGEIIASYRDLTGTMNDGVEHSLRELHKLFGGAERPTACCPLYDAALVDEGQDLTPQAFEILKRIARHVTVCMDSRQQLYEQRCEEPDILQALGIRKCNLTILGAYRCCPYITRLAASLLQDPAERQAFLNQAKTAQRERLTPLLYIASSADEEKNRLAQIIKDRQLTGDRIAILLSNNAKLFSLAGLLTEAGLEVEVPPKGRETKFFKHDFKSERPKLLTYYGAKGLTFETVIMPHLVPTSFLQVGQERLAKLLFVGITRATQWVYMSTVEGPMLPIILQIAELEKNGVITLQRAGDSLPLFDGPSRNQESRTPSPCDELTDLL